MSFPWLECTPGRSDGTKLRTKVACAEIADRAGTLYRLGFTQEAACARLCQRTAWEYEHKRPEGLSDQAIRQIVADTYARRPGGW